MTGTGRAMVSTPAITHNEPTILPQKPTGLKCRGNLHRLLLDQALLNDRLQIKIIELKSIEINVGDV